MGKTPIVPDAKAKAGEPKTPPGLCILSYCEHNEARHTDGHCSGTNEDSYQNGYKIWPCPDHAFNGVESDPSYKQARIVSVTQDADYPNHVTVAMDTRFPETGPCWLDWGDGSLPQQAVPTMDHYYAIPSDADYKVTVSASGQFGGPDTKSVTIPKAAATITNAFVQWGTDSGTDGIQVKWTVGFSYGNAGMNTAELEITYPAEAGGSTTAKQTVSATSSPATLFYGGTATAGGKLQTPVAVLVHNASGIPGQGTRYPVTVPDLTFPAKTPPEK
jgi:hypothetical protein